MHTDAIEAVGIDDAGSLWVKPVASVFPQVYREAMEVRWDPERLCLYAPRPRDWTYADWFQQIRAAAREQGVELNLVPATTWSGVDAGLKRTLESISLDGWETLAPEH